MLVFPSLRWRWWWWWWKCLVASWLVVPSLCYPLVVVVAVVYSD